MIKTTLFLFVCAYSSTVGFVSSAPVDLEVAAWNGNDNVNRIRMALAQGKLIQESSSEEIIEQSPEPTTEPEPMCGNNKIEPGEQCDGHEGCSAGCRWEFCEGNEGGTIDHAYNGAEDLAWAMHAPADQAVKFRIAAADHTNADIDDFLAIRDWRKPDCKSLVHLQYEPFVTPIGFDLFSQSNQVTVSYSNDGDADIGIGTFTIGYCFVNRSQKIVGEDESRSFNYPTGSNQVIFNGMSICCEVRPFANLEIEMDADFNVDNGEPFCTASLGAGLADGVKVYTLENGFFIVDPSKTICSNQADGYTLGLPGNPQIVLVCLETNEAGINENFTLSSQLVGST